MIEFLLDIVIFLVCILIGKLLLVWFVVFCIFIRVRFGLVLILKVSVILIFFELVVFDFIYNMFGVLFNFCLSGIVIDLDVVLVVVFGNEVDILIDGGVILGYWLIGKVKSEIRLVSKIISEIIMVNIGCLIKKCENIIKFFVFYFYFFVL